MTEDEKLSGSLAIPVSQGEPEDLGEFLYEWQIPSDEALVSSLVVRVTDFLVGEGFISKSERNRVGLCVVEALRNAVMHGNREDFKKLVKVRVYLQGMRWTVEVEDEGKGYDPEEIASPLGEDGMWGESGRGLSLISINSDQTRLFRSGATIVFSRFL